MNLSGVNGRGFEVADSDTGGRDGRGGSRVRSSGLGLGRDETNDNESFVGVLRDYDEIFESLTFLESEAKVVGG